MTVELTPLEARWLSILAAEALRNDSDWIERNLSHHQSAYDALQEACNWESSHE